MAVPQTLEGVIWASHCSGLVSLSMNLTWTGTSMAQPSTLRMTKMSRHMVVKRRNTVASMPT